MRWGWGRRVLGCAVRGQDSEHWVWGWPRTLRHREGWARTSSEAAASWPPSPSHTSRRRVIMEGESSGRKRNLEQRDARGSMMLRGGE